MCFPHHHHHHHHHHPPTQRRGFPADMRMVYCCCGVASSGVHAHSFLQFPVADYSLQGEERVFTTKMWSSLSTKLVTVTCGSLIPSLTGTTSCWPGYHQTVRTATFTRSMPASTRPPFRGSQRATHRLFRQARTAPSCCTASGSSLALLVATNGVGMLCASRSHVRMLKPKTPDPLSLVDAYIFFCDLYSHT